MIESLVSYFKSNEKKGEGYAINAEFDHLVVKKADLTAVSYKDQAGIETCLKALAQKGWEATLEDDIITSLQKGQAKITLGFGSQLNFSVKGIKNTKELDKLYLDFLDEVFPLLEEQGNLLLAIGYQPKTKADEIEVIPAQRKELIEKYLKANKKEILDNLKTTAAVKVSVNYFNEEDFQKVIQIAYILQPVMTALFDNSPVYENEDYEKACLKENLYSDFVKQGINILVGEYGYEEYAQGLKNYADFVTEDITAENIKEINPLLNSKITVDEAININAVDSLPYPLNIAYITLWKGLLCDKDNIEPLFEFVHTLKGGDLLAVKEEMQTKGLDAKFGEGTLRDLAKDIFFMSSLKLNKDEKHYLQLIETIIYKNVTAKQITKRQLNKLV